MNEILLMAGRDLSFPRVGNAPRRHLPARCKPAPSSFSTPGLSSAAGETTTKPQKPLPKPPRGLTMTLEDFERSLAESREDRRHERSSRDKDGDPDRSRRHRHHHHHHHRRRSASRSRERGKDRHRESRRDDEERHRHKRSRHSNDNADVGEHGHKRRHRRDSLNDREPLEESSTAQTEKAPQLKRDAWMEAPSALDFDYVQRRDPHLQEQPEPKMLQADIDTKIHKRELNEHLRDLKEGKVVENIENEPAQHEVDYTFGDAGSHWRMTKLKAVYREAKETGRRVEEVAIERFGDLRAFDDAREEEAELDRRERYGEAYVGKTKPTGELFQERKLEHGVHRDPRPRDEEGIEPAVRDQGKQIDTIPPPRTTQHLDATALNRLRARMMKAKLKGSSDAAELEEQYNAAAGLLANRKEADTVVLGVMHNRMLAGGTRGEVKLVETRRGHERGRVEQNEDMTIEDMVTEERRTRGQAGGEGLRLAERIAKDSTFNVSSVSSLPAPLASFLMLTTLERYRVHGR